MFAALSESVVTKGKSPHDGCVISNTVLVWLVEDQGLGPKVTRRPKMLDTLWAEVVLWYVFQGNRKRRSKLMDLK